MDIACFLGSSSLNLYISIWLIHSSVSWTFLSLFVTDCFLFLFINHFSISLFVCFLFLSFYMQDQDQHLSWHWCPISSHPSYLVRTYVTDNLFTSSSNLQSFFLRHRSKMLHVLWRVNHLKKNLRDCSRLVCEIFGMKYNNIFGPFNIPAIMV